MQHEEKPFNQKIGLRSADADFARRLDLNADGAVDFGDFVLFAQKFGLESNDDGYDARFDLGGDGAIGFSDFVICAGAFGQGA